MRDVKAQHGTAQREMSRSAQGPGASSSQGRVEVQLYREDAVWLLAVVSQGLPRQRGLKDLGAA